MENRIKIPTNEYIKETVDDIKIDVTSIQYGLGTLKEYYKEPLYTRVYYIIDQRGLISDPEDMVSPNYIKDSNGNLVKISDSGATGSPSTNLLTWLKLNTHAYVGSYADTNFEDIYLKQLDDSDRTKYIDGTSALEDIQGGPTGINDVVVKFPCDVYYKSEAYTPPGETEPNEDYVLITITTKLLDGESESDWQKWDKNWLIGVYPSTRATHDKVKTFCSQSNKVIAFEDSNYNGYVISIGKKSTTNYDYYKFTSILFWGYYKTLDAVSILGVGSEFKSYSTLYPKITGNTDKLARIDTTYETGTGAEVYDEDLFASGVEYILKSPNFWHIEGFIDKSRENVHLLKPIGNKPSSETDTRIQYLRNYIAKYGYPKIIELDGTEVQLTEELYNELPINAVFIAFLSEPRWIHDNTVFDYIYKIIRLPDINYSYNNITKLKFGKYCDIFPKSTDKIGSNAYYCARHLPNYGVWSFGYIVTRATDYRNGLTSLSQDGMFNGNSMRKSTRMMFNGTEDSVHMIK